ncbi:MAG: integrase/recombinase XerD [Hyphomicrobiales bacterium]|jgi:integrase/recombinase XerD|nr:integrase/recombinase XerD [Hyphomicrobiales bacterium]
MQLRVAADEFLQFCAVERQLSQHSVQAYTADLADFCSWQPAGATTADTTEPTLRAYLTEMLGTRKLAIATVRRRFACLRTFFRRLASLGELPDPFANWRLQLPRRKRLPRALSRSEVSSLLRSSDSFGSTQFAEPDAGLGLAILLMVSTGIRVGELCKLTIDDVSPDGTSLRIQGKGSRDRIAYIADAALRAKLRGSVQQLRKVASSYGALFVNRHGLPMKPQSIRSKLRRYASEVGLSRRVTPHMLRHTAATLLIETGVDIRFVQRLLGHSSIATTEIYTHVSDEALRATLERADVLGTFA